jgi:predicted RNA binding protein YcfA (HicA-like mRNA interferase family)
MKYKKIDLDRIRGSHFTFENALNGETITIPSHNKKVKKIYIKKILKLIKNSNEKL